MNELPHSIRKQTLIFETASEEQAVKLRARVQEVNRRRFLPLIERLCDELSMPGRQIKIPRLDIDLGVLSASDWEREAERRLARELRDALETALREATSRPAMSGESAAGSAMGGGEVSKDSTSPRSQSLEASRLELLEYYLLYGRLPFWAPTRLGFSFVHLFDELAQSAPEALARMLLKHGRRSRVLERLARQLPESGFERLIGLLEPRHHELILVYIDHLRDAHRVEPLVALADEALVRMLRMLTEVYLVRDPGTQFNRKTFVRSVLRGVAESQGVAYDQILATFRRGLERLAGRRPLDSSLPGVLVELARESRSDEVTEEAPRLEPRRAARVFQRAEMLEILAYYLRFGLLPWHALVRDPHLRVERVLDLLVHLPRSSLTTLFDRETEQERTATLLRAVEGLPTPNLTRFIRRLIPAIAMPESPLRAAFEAFSQRAEDRPLFYARLIASVLDGDPFDFELLVEVAERPSVSALPREPGQWPAHALQSALLRPTRREASGEVARSGGDEYLDALLTRHPEDARQFFVTLGEEAPEMYSAVLIESPPALFDRTLDLLCREEAETLRALTLTFAEIPAPWRPSSGTVRRALLKEALRIAGGEPLDASSFARILAELFPASLSSPVRLVLERQADAWSAPEQKASRSAHGRALRRAITETVSGVVQRREDPPGGSGDARRAHVSSRGVAEEKREKTKHPRRPQRPLGARTAFGLGSDEESEEPSDTIYVDNAGLVLTATFLPRLFRTLDMLESDEESRPRWRDRETVSRAVHLLQYLVDGQTSTPEPFLVLNKLLCGAPSSVPVAPGIDMTEQESEICDRLLLSMIANWKAIGSTSVAGLRETFLQREGKIYQISGGRRLQVQRKTLDVLVDRIPWSVSVVKHRWMREALYVSW